MWKLYIHINATNNAILIKDNWFCRSVYTGFIISTLHIRLIRISKCVPYNKKLFLTVHAFFQSLLVSQFWNHVAELTTGIDPKHILFIDPVYVWAHTPPQLARVKWLILLTPIDVARMVVLVVQWKELTRRELFSSGSDWFRLTSSPMNIRTDRKILTSTDFRNVGFKLRP